MSSVEKVVQTSNQLITNYETSKFLLGNNEFNKGNLTASGADVELTEGLVMGRISATGLLTPLTIAATDGSQYPVGICIKDKTVSDGDTEEIVVVNKGRVNEDKITFSTGTMDSAIGVANNQKILRDWLNDLGLVLISAEELTGYDNYL